MYMKCPCPKPFFSRKKKNKGKFRRLFRDTEPSHLINGFLGDSLPPPPSSVLPEKRRKKQEHAFKDLLCTSTKTFFEPETFRVLSGSLGSVAQLAVVVNTNFMLLSIWLCL